MWCVGRLNVLYSIRNQNILIAYSIGTQTSSQFLFDKCVKSVNSFKPENTHKTSANKQTNRVYKLNVLSPKNLNNNIMTMTCNNNVNYVDIGAIFMIETLFIGHPLIP